MSARWSAARAAMVVLAVVIGCAAFAPPAGASVPPTVTSVTPSNSSTAGGVSVVIGGTGFTGATNVEFGAGNAASYFTVNSSTQITVVAPAGSAGTVDVTVTGPGGTSATSAADHFTYVTPPLPTVTAVSPGTGSSAGGNTVTITGTGLTGATDVDFGPANTAASWTVVTPTQISATTPAGVVGTVDVTVTTLGGTSATSSADHYTYTTSPQPVVSSVTPSSGPTAGGTGVTVTGTGFTGTYDIEFGTGNPAGTWTVVSDTEITVTTPATAAGTVDVLVTTPGGASATSSLDHYSFVSPALPVISGISPVAGTTAGGTTVTISGTGFTGATAAAFGAKPALNFSVVSDTEMTAVSPGGSVGTVVDITVTKPSGTSLTSLADQFTYAGPPPVPVITSVSPSAGPTAGGTEVTITGTNLAGATAVAFGTGHAAATFTIDSDTEIKATSPAESAGVVDVRVTTPGGMSATSNADHFTFIAPPAPPTVTGVSPNNGSTAGGTVVTISGTALTGATAVLFGTKSASFSVNSASQITAHSPAGAAGTVNVTVTTPVGTSGTNGSDQFTYKSSGGGGGGGPTPHGYWLVAGDGGIFTFGSAHFYGSTGNLRLQRPVVGMTPTADRAGYWMVATDGGMFAFGDARFFGSIPGVGLAPADSAAPKRLAAPIVAMVASPTGQGYLLVASDGGVFAFGNALFHGSCPGIGGCNGSVIAVVPDAGEHGYWVVTSTGRVYPFGDATAFGQPGATPAPITGATASADGHGYLIVDAKGDVYNYGDAQKYGKAPSGLSVPSAEIVGIVPTSDGLGYWLMGRAGSVYNYGDAPSDGSMAGRALNAPIVTAAGF
jgi:hypothetical protein